MQWVIYVPIEGTDFGLFKSIKSVTSEGGNDIKQYLFEQVEKNKVSVMRAVRVRDKRAPFVWHLRFDEDGGELSYSWAEEVVECESVLLDNRQVS